MDELDETVLDVAQRQKRAQILRRYKAKIERAREISKKRMAPKENIKKRAYAQARQIVRRRVAGKRGAEYEKLGPSEKMAIDRAVEGKQKLIKKIALRLIPKVKSAEQQRLSTYMKGHSLQNHGAPEGKNKESSGSSSVQESFNQLFSEQFPPVAERSQRKQPEEASNSTVKKAGGKEVKGNKNITQFAKFDEERECNSSAYKAIAKKSRKSGVNEDILGEVYDRGMESWYEETGVTQQQYAFARVNSYINQGKSYFNEDADLHELSTPLLHSYLDKAKKTTPMQKQRKVRGSDPAEHKEAERKRVQRNDYMKTATKKISKQYAAEDTQIDELSINTLDKYIDKASNDRTKQLGNERKYNNRLKGVSQALKKGNEQAAKEGPKKLKPVKTDYERQMDDAHRYIYKEENELDESFRKSLMAQHMGKSKEQFLSPPNTVGGKATKKIHHNEKHDIEVYHGMQVYKTQPHYVFHNDKLVHYTNSRDNAMKHAEKLAKKLDKGQKVNEETELDEGVKETIKGIIRREKSKDMPLVQTRRDYATNKAGEAYEKGDTRKGNQYSAWAERDRKKAGDRSTNPTGKYRTKTSDYTNEAFSNWSFGMEPGDKTKVLTGDHKGKRGVVVSKHEDGAVYKIKHEDGSTMKHHISTLSEPIEEAREPGKAYVKRMKRDDGSSMIVSSTKWGQKKYWRDSEGGLKKAREHAKADLDEAAESIVPQKPGAASKRRMGAQSVERDSTPQTPTNDADHPTSPASSHNKHQQIKKKIIDEEGNSQIDPKKRLVGTDELVKAFKKDTPGQCNEDLNESFNIAFAAGVGVSLTAADLGMRAQGGFALHPSVMEEIARREQEEMEEEVVTADKAPVVIPSHKDANGNTIPAKTVMRKKDKTIIKSGNVHNGEDE